MSLLNQQQQKLIDSVQDLIDKDPALIAQATPETTERFLRARDGNLDQASKLIRNAFIWRTKARPQDIKWEEVKEEASTGKVFIASFTDVEGSLVVILRPREQNSKNTERYTKLFYFIMERGGFKADKQIGQQKITLFADFEGYYMNSIPSQVAIDGLKTLQNCYPERLKIAILQNAPTVFNILWNVLKPVLDSKTAKKIVFWKKSMNEKQLMQQHFGDNSSSLFDKFDIEEHSKEMLQLQQDQNSYLQQTLSRHKNTKPQGMRQNNHSGDDEIEFHDAQE